MTTKPTPNSKPKPQRTAPDALNAESLQNLTTPTADAEKVLAGLTARREKLVAERAAAERETGKHSYAAHAKGDLKAVEALDQIATTIMRLDARIREVDLAITEAGERLRLAEESESKAQAREVAFELLARADAIAENAQTLDEANTIRVEASLALAEELETCRALAQRIGLHVPNHQQLLAMGSRAERTTMAQTPWAREVGEAIAAGERRNHASYANGWRDQIVKAARALLGDKQDEEAT